MKTQILRALVKLQVDKYPFTPKRLVSRLRYLRDIISTWDKMPGDDERLVYRTNAYWTDLRIKSALDAFSVEYKDSPLRFYTRVLMASQQISEYEAILDFGAGTGINSHQMSKNFPGTKFSCYDIAYHVPRVFDAFSRAMSTQRVSYHNTLNAALIPGQLVYSNLVFSHLSKHQLTTYLAVFKKNKSDILMIANTLTKQDDKSPLTKVRSGNLGLFDHNYRKFFNEAGYRIQWLFQIEDPASADKKMTIIFATVCSH